MVVELDSYPCWIDKIVSWADEMRISEDIIPRSVTELLNLRCLTFYENTNLSYLPDEVGHLSKPTSLQFIGCDQLKDLPASIRNLTQLENLICNYCENLVDVPETICKLENSRVLDLSGC